MKGRNKYRLITALITTIGNIGGLLVLSERFSITNLGVYLIFAALINGMICIMGNGMINDLIDEE